MREMSSYFCVNETQAPRKPLPASNPKIRAFHQSLPHYSPTSLVSLPEIAKELGIRYLLLKNESSRLGLPAFKILGASWAVAQAIAKRVNLQGPVEGISLQHLAGAAQAADLTLYAATDGNHGRAVARMAKYLGIKARIFFPCMLDQDARSNIVSEGAAITAIDSDYDATVLATKAAAEAHQDGKGLLISDTALEPGDEIAQWIVDGYQTMFDEIQEQLHSVAIQHHITHVISPVGVGSLCQAVVTHFGRVLEDEKPVIMTVEPAAAPCLKQSLEAGQIVSVQTSYTICTGMCCGTLSANAWPILQDGVKIAMTVDDVDVDKAVLELHSHGIDAGPCGAAALAGLRQLVQDGGINEAQLGEEAVVVILCTEGERQYQVR